MANSQVQDDRVFASSLYQQSKTSTTSDHDGDMTVSVEVRKDGSISNLKESVDGVHEVLETAKLSNRVQTICTLLILGSKDQSAICMI